MPIVFKASGVGITLISPNQSRAAMSYPVSMRTTASPALMTQKL